MAYTEKEIKKAKETIIQGLYNGRSLRSILLSNKSIPSRTIVYQWLNEKHELFDELFLDNYERARENSADIDVDKMEDLNEELRNGEIDPQSARIIADNLKWTAGRKKPKKYGAKIDVDFKDQRKQLSLEETEQEILELKQKLGLNESI